MSARNFWGKSDPSGLFSNQGHPGRDKEGHTGAEQWQGLGLLQDSVALGRALACMPVRCHWTKHLKADAEEKEGRGGKGGAKDEEEEVEEKQKFSIKEKKRRQLRVLVGRWERAWRALAGPGACDGQRPGGLLQHCGSHAVQAGPGQGLPVCPGSARPVLVGSVY